jgi:hypothetical protein
VDSAWLRNTSGRSAKTSALSGVASRERSSFRYCSGRFW